MHRLELKVPPIAVGLICAALMWLVSWAFPAFGLVLPGRDILALSFAVASAIILLSAVASFRRARTTVNPMKPESAASLVRSGVYRASRNPMYLAVLLILTAWAIYLSNVLAFLFLPAFVLYMNRFQIQPEETALGGNFGHEFEKYRSRVRRWI